MSGKTLATGPLSAEELALLGETENALFKGLELRAWYRDKLKHNSWSDRFEEATSFRRPDTSFGFFDHAEIDGQRMAVMGNYQSMLYDQPKTGRGEEGEGALLMREQMREFILRYFMRISDFRQPQGYLPPNAHQPPVFLRPLSWCPKDDPSRIGFGFSQHFYKTVDGRLGRFPVEERDAIVDLRQIGSDYEWILVHVDIFDFSFSLQPFGSDTPSLSLPLKTGSYLVVNRDFVLQDESLKHGLGSYGFGYSFVRNPGSSLLNYGPGEFEVAFETIDFHVLTDGRVRVDMAFASNRPDRIMNVSVDPLCWAVTLGAALPVPFAEPMTAAMRGMASFSPLRGLTFDPLFSLIDMGNFASAGLLARELCISKETLFREFLLKHFQQHYESIIGSLQTWRQFPDWLNSEALPAWVKTGVSS